MLLVLIHLAQILDKDDLNIPKREANASALQNILNTVFLIAGGVAVIFVVIGGLQYVLSTGDPNSTSKAKNTILYAVIGLILSLLALVIVRIVTGLFQ